MSAEIKTVTTTKDCYEDLIALASHSLKGVIAEEYDVEYLLRCMAVVTMVEADFGVGTYGSISREKFNLLMGGIDNGTADSTDE